MLNQLKRTQEQGKTEKVILQITLKKCGKISTRLEGITGEQTLPFEFLEDFAT